MKSLRVPFTVIILECLPFLVVVYFTEAVSGKLVGSLAWSSCLQRILKMFGVSCFKRRKNFIITYIKIMFPAHGKNAVQKDVK